MPCSRCCPTCSCCGCCRSKATHKNSRREKELSEDNTSLSMVTPGLTLKQQKLILKSSELMFNDNNLEYMGVEFLISFFKQFPQHQIHFKMFRNLEPEELRTLPSFTNHGRKVIEQMRKLALSITNPDRLRENLTWIANTHSERYIHSSQLREMMLHFVDFSKQTLGSQLKNKHYNAWKKLIANLTDTIRKEEVRNSVRMRSLPTIQEEGTIIDASSFGYESSCVDNDTFKNSSSSQPISTHTSINLSVTSETRRKDANQNMYDTNLNSTSTGAFRSRVKILNLSNAHTSKTAELFRRWTDQRRQTNICLKTIIRDTLFTRRKNGHD